MQYVDPFIEFRPVADPVNKDVPLMPNAVAMFLCGIHEDFFYDNFEVNVAKFKAFCEKEGVFYYARPREDFSEWEAQKLAQEAGAKWLILEDLS